MAEPGGTIRLDLFLWYARIAKTRAVARTIAVEGRMRIDGRPVDRAHAAVRVGQVLAFAQRDRVRVLRVERLPARRGPPAEARALYADLAPVDGGEGSRQGQAPEARAQLEEPQ